MHDTPPPVSPAPAPPLTTSSNETTSAPLAVTSSLPPTSTAGPLAAPSEVPTEAVKLDALGEKVETRADARQGVGMNDSVGPSGDSGTSVGIAGAAQAVAPVDTVPIVEATPAKGEGKDDSGKVLQGGSEREGALELASEATVLPTVGGGVSSSVEAIPTLPVESVSAPAPSNETDTTASTVSSSDPSLPTPLATLPVVLAPPTPSVSPAPHKKFASSLSVNKKFLEKASAGSKESKPEVKATIARLATPPPTIAASTTHPRLLTGKISSGPTPTLAATTAAPGVTGWLKTAPLPEVAPRMSLSTPSDALRGGTYERGRGIGGFGMASRGRGAAVWGSRAGSMGEGAMGIGGEFPTAAEAANAKTLRAAAVQEQIVARDRAIQARAAAVAATNASLLQGLDAFRGVHLDPNAHHWDEMGDEDNDFLDDTIEFGDGTQYKIDADALNAPPASNTPLREPHYSELATLEAPLAPGETLHDPVREERFKDDYDRTWKKPVVASSSPADGKNLFNDRLGKFERAAAPVAGRSATDVPPHLATRRPSITSPRQGAAMLPPQIRRDGPPPTTPWGREAPRRGSNEQGRRPSIDQTARRPSIDLGGRQLPPHLAGNASGAPPPARGHPDRHDPPHRTFPPLGTSPTTAPRVVAALVPPSRPVVAAPPPAPVVVIAPTPVAAPTVAPVIDLDVLHHEKMHALAERAKKRKAEEEAARVAEDARKKEANAERGRLAAEAKLAAIAASQPAVVAPTDRRESISRPQANGAAPDRPNLWRERAPSGSTVGTTRPPLPPSKPEPTQILARAPPPHLAQRAPAPVPAPLLPTPAAVMEDKVESPVVPVVEERVCRKNPPALVASPITAPEVATPPASLPTPPTVDAESILPILPPSTTVPLSPTLNRNAPKVAATTFKVPELSMLDDLMSRIKGAMSVPKSDANETIPRSDTSSPSLPPTVKLPLTSPTILPRQPLASSQAASDFQLQVSSKPPALASDAKGKGRGRAEAPKPVRGPQFENRDVPEPFQYTRVERSLSPPPAWKAYVVKMPAYPKLRPAMPKMLKAFAAKAVFRVDILSWEPPLAGLSSRTLSRDDSLIPRRYIKNVLVCQVNIPKIRSAAEVVEIARVATADRSARELALKARTLEAEARSAAKVEQLAAPLPDFRDATASVDSTTAPSTAALFDLSPVRSQPPRSNLPGRSTNGFRSASDEVAERSSSTSSRFRMTSELNGEVVQMGPRESLAAPGADAASKLSLTSTFDGSNPTWSTQPVPLSLSVLNPVVPSLWSAPASDSPAHTRSISLGGAQLENSLQGVADPEDFGSTIPSTLADLKSEDGEASIDVKDDPRLRAAATSFPSVNEALSPAAARFTPLSRPPMHPQYPSIGSPIAYQSQSFMSSPAPNHSPYLQSQSQHYPSFSVSPQPGSYIQQPHQGYSQGPFALAQPAQGSPFSSYRPQVLGITNPALIAQGYGSPSSYGAVGGGGGQGGGSFGAVGAGGISHSPVNRGSSYGVRSPSMSSAYGPFSNGFSVGGGAGGGGGGVQQAGYPMDSRQYAQQPRQGGYSTFPPSPVPMPQYIQQQLLYSHHQHQHGGMDQRGAAQQGQLPGVIGRSGMPGQQQGMPPPLYRRG